MIRIVIENILLFLLPTLVYVIFVAVTRDNTRQGIFDGAPLVWLLMTGTALMLLVLAYYGHDTGGRPGQVYVPPSMKDGHIEPGTIK